MFRALFRAVFDSKNRIIPAQESIMTKQAYVNGVIGVVETRLERSLTETERNNGRWTTPKEYAKVLNKLEEEGFRITCTDKGFTHIRWDD